MHSGKICFIACITDDEMERELMDNISSLSVPEGIEIEYLGVREVPSICAGFNEAIEATDARYKVFMRQEARILEPEFISKVIGIFQNNRIGAIGFRGSDRLSSDMVVEHGFLYGPDPEKELPVEGDYQEVAVITGDVIVTQADFKWDEGFEEVSGFHEISACAELIRKGSKIVVPNQENGSWIDVSAYKMVRDEIYEKNRLYAKSKYSSVFGISRNTRRIGIVSFDEIDCDDFLTGLLMTGNDVDVIGKLCSVYSDLPADSEKMVSRIKEYYLDAVISFDFCPAVSDACENCGIPYISWVYDAPLQALYEEQIRNKQNYIFSFDKEQVKETTENGAVHVFYQPLATGFAGISVDTGDQKDRAAFGCDVSFVGSLYWDEVYDTLKAGLSEKAIREYSEIIHEALGKWDGNDRIYGRLSKESLAELQGRLSDEIVDGLKMDMDSYIVSRFLGRELAYLERCEMCRRLSKYDFKLFGGSEKIVLEGVKTCPRVGYDTDLPKVYSLSKINIGSTLHTIKSGVPMRVFDIIGAGGFLLTNFQPELPELFKMGQEIEVYHDFEEMEDKVKYYLTHENERERIISNGYKKVSEKYNYNRQLKLILSKVGI
jgi:spore maturation protein CgeB